MYFGSIGIVTTMPRLPLQRSRPVSSSNEFRRTFCVEGLNPFLEILRLTQAAIAMAFQFDRDRQQRIFRVVQQLLCRALCKRGKAAKLIDELVGRRFEFTIGN